MRVADSDAASNLAQESVGSHREQLIARIRNAMPNPIAFASYSTSCLVASVYNDFISSPLADFSVAFTKVLYDDSKAIYNGIKSTAESLAQEITEYLFNNTELIYVLLNEQWSAISPRLERVWGITEAAGIRPGAQRLLSVGTGETIGPAADVAEIGGLDLTIDLNADAVDLSAEDQQLVNELSSLWEGYDIAAKIVAVLKTAVLSQGALEAAAQALKHAAPGLGNVAKGKVGLEALGKHLFRQGVKHPWSGAKAKFLKAAKTLKVAKAKLVVAKALIPKMVVGIKAAFLAKLKASAAFVSPVAIPAATVAVYAVILRGTTGAIYDILTGEYDDYYAKRDTEKARILKQCEDNLSRMGNISLENRRIIKNSFDELLKSYGL